MALKPWRPAYLTFQVDTTKHRQNLTSLSGYLERMQEELAFTGGEADVALKQSVATVTGLPALPNEGYPLGKVVFNESDGKLYRNYNNTWTAETSAEDLTGELNPSTIPVGAITSERIADFAVTAKKFNTVSHVIY